ncbi:MAG: DUF4965 domain-containing protein, partial [Oscillospiraceae bacterium]|nr:DUF4965 domain-containing protein [Oscillospiraceae bacterium]
MKLRAPAVPLITVDPYFSVWSAADKLTDCPTTHWTDRANASLEKGNNHRPNTINGTVSIDGTVYRFMGVGEAPAMEQVSLDIDALTTTYVFEAAGVNLNASFFTPLFPDDYERMTRPVSYLKLIAENTDGKEHTVTAKVSASEELCLDHKGQMPVTTELLTIGGKAAAKMGSVEQPVLAKKGDDIRIDWGYLYLCTDNGTAAVEETDGMTFITVEADLSKPALITFAYDDIASMVYFGKQLKSYWNRNGKTIETAIEEAYADYDELCKKADWFASDLTSRAEKAGGEKYADMLSLAFRQVMAAHKLVLDEEGQILYISKECFSNGCAATVDVSYPSIPMYLYYNPRLVMGMMRPIFRYAESEAWPFDFAPHDVGTYPLVNGQVYGDNALHMQMPVEECGNMLLMAAALLTCEKRPGLMMPHMDTLKTWAKYLLKYGADPGEQLCTDDFAGHLAHNCNLSLKAIMGLVGMWKICTMMGEDGSEYLDSAKEMAAVWAKNAANGDGSYRLAFDRPGTFSMKYNMIWDKVFGTGIFPDELKKSEFDSNFSHFNRYGMPLDNRSDYTKSDWLVWTA